MQSQRGMASMPTYRRGGRYQQYGPADNGGLSGVCTVIFLFLLLLAPPVVLFLPESARHGTYTALLDALNSDVLPAFSPSVEAGSFVHGTSHDITATSTDPDMTVSIPGGLTLRRRTEYCQWQEIRRRSCDTCTRTVRARDGSTSEERYDCDCVFYYDYVKGWRSHRISSLPFDQPAAHHNPQRDPMPGRTFASDNAVLTMDEFDVLPDGGPGSAVKMGKTTATATATATTASLDPTMLANSVRGARFRPVNFVPGGVPPVPPAWQFWKRWIPDRTRYEPTDALRSTVGSHAAREHSFVYVGQGGYFFSPYEASNYENLFKYFVEYLEGSLFDWQVGDLMPSCRAGDVRFRYEVQDPSAVSVLGEVSDRTKSALKVRPKLMRNGREVGMVHAGRVSFTGMIAAEDSDSRWAAIAFRALLILWAVAAGRLLGAMTGKDVGCSSFPAQLASMGAMWCANVGCVWTFLWGTTVDTLFMIIGAILFAGVANKHALPSEVPGGLHAVWCMVARWAKVPPSWRVEDSYRGGANEKVM